MQSILEKSRSDEMLIAPYEGASRNAGIINAEINNCRAIFYFI